MPHKATPLLRMILPALLFTAGFAQAKTVSGVPLPGKSKQLAKNRYLSPYPLNETVRWLKKALTKRGQKVRFERVIDLPDVVADHAKSPSGKSKWSDINVSQYGGSVKIFIIPQQQ